MSELQHPLLNKKRKTFFKKLFSVTKTGTIRASIYTLSASAIGAGIFSLPWALHNSGLILGVIFMFSSVFLTAFFYRVMLQAMQDLKEFSYTKIVFLYYGKFWQWMAEFSIFVGILGSCAAYQALIVNYTIQVLTRLGIEYSKSWPYFLNNIVFVLLCFITFPKQMTSLRYLSMGCIVSLAYINIVVLAQSPGMIANQEDIDQYLEYANFDWNSVHSLSLMLYAFDGILGLTVVYSQLKDRNYEKGKKIVDRSLVIVSVLYFCLSILGYFSYIDDVPKLITNGQTGTVNWPLLIGKIFTAVTLVATITLNLHPLRNMTNQFVNRFRIQPGGEVQFYIVNYLYLIAINVLATCFPDVVVFFQIVGGFAAVMMMIVLPVMIYWKIEKNVVKIGVATVCAALGSFVGFSSAVLTIIS